MTDQEGDWQHYLTLGIQGVWKTGLSPEAKPMVTNYFFRYPESRESNSIPVTRGISHYLFYYTSIMVIIS